MDSNPPVDQSDFPFEIEIKFEEIPEIKRNSFPGAGDDFSTTVLLFNGNERRFTPKPERQLLQQRCQLCERLFENAEQLKQHSYKCIQIANQNALKRLHTAPTKTVLYTAQERTPDTAKKIKIAHRPIPVLLNEPKIEEQPPSTSEFDIDQELNLALQQKRTVSLRPRTRINNKKRNNSYKKKREDKRDEEKAARRRIQGRESMRRWRQKMSKEARARENEASKARRARQPNNGKKKKREDKTDDEEKAAIKRMRDRESMRRRRQNMSEEARARENEVRKARRARQDENSKKKKCEDMMEEEKLIKRIRDRESNRRWRQSMSEEAKAKENEARKARRSRQHNNSKKNKCEDMTDEEKLAIKRMRDRESMRRRRQKMSEEAKAKENEARKARRARQIARR